MPFKYRILLCFMGLLGMTLGSLLLFSFQWRTNRAKEDVNYRLTQNIETLKRIHKAGISDRTQDYKCLATEPRFQALAEVQDRATLQFAASEVKQELGCAIFAFLTPSGEILAWDGEGKEILGAKLRASVLGQPEQVTEIFFTGEKAFEVTIICIRIHGILKGYILGARVINSSILNDYNIALGAIVELCVGDKVIASSTAIQPSPEKLLSSVLPLKDSLRFVVKSDPEDVTASLRDNFRALIYVSTICILIGAVVSMVIADQFARPIQNLTHTTQLVGQGNFSIRSDVTGAPELQVLSQNFNWMIESIKSYQEKLEENTRKLQEQVVEKTNHAQQLSYEIAAHKQTMQRLNEAIITARNASKAKDIFLANMSHELRTPLHGILSFSRFGVKKAGNADREKLLNYFKKILFSGEGLLNLLNELLDLAKLESGKMEFKFDKIDFNALIASVTDELSLFASEKSINIVYNKPDLVAKIVFDQQRISQVLRNLLSNAIKFSPKKSTILITVSQRNGAIRTTIQDEGLGIPEGELDSVFNTHILDFKSWQKCENKLVYQFA